MKTKNILSLVNTKLSPFSQLLLLLNYSFSKNALLLFLLIFPKFFAMISISLNFCLETSSEYISNYYLTKYTSEATLSYLLPYITYDIYFILSVLFFLLVMCNSLFIGYYYFQIKYKDTTDISLIWVSKYLFLFIAIFGQHIMEFYSFSFLIIFRNRWTLPSTNNVIYSYYNKTPLLINKPKNDIIYYFILGINFLSYIMTNALIYLSFLVLNSPFNPDKLILKIRHKSLAFLFIFITNIYGVHYFIIFIGTKTKIIVFKSLMFSIISFFIVCESGCNLHKYETPNWLYHLIAFLNSFSLVSMIIEIIIGINNFKLHNSDIIMYLIFKVFFAFVLTKMVFYYKKKYLLNICSFALFERVDTNKILNIIEAYHYLLDILIAYKVENIKDDNIINLFVTHKVNCKEENCQCKNQYPLLEEKNKNFVARAYLILENVIERAFAATQLLQSGKGSYVVAEYHYRIKGNLLFAIAVIQAHIANNIDKFSWFESLLAYSLNNNYISLYSRQTKCDQKGNEYKSIFNNLQERKNFTKIVIKYCENIDTICTAKMNFENSLKIVNDVENDILYVESLYLSRNILCDLLSRLINLCQITRVIKFDMLRSKRIQSHTQEFYYLIYLYFTNFENKCSQRLKRIFSSIDGLSGRNLRDDELGKKFETFLNSRSSNDPSFLILDFWKGLKISYCSSTICNAAGFSLSEIKGEDVSIFIPKQIRQKHQIEVLNFVMKSGENTRINTSVHMCDKNEFLIPIDLTCAIMPNLTRCVSIICEVLMKNYQKKMRLMLDENFSDISISKTLETHFVINLMLLKKCDYDYADIFDFNRKKIKKFFLNYIDNYKKYQELTYNFVENYATIFGYDSSLLSMEPDIQKKKKETTQDTFSKENIEQLKSKLKRQSVFFFSKDRFLITNNIINGFNRISDMSVLTEEYSRKFLELKASISRSGSYSSKIHFKIKIKPISNSFVYIVELIDSMNETPLIKSVRSLASVTSGSYQKKKASPKLLYLDQPTLIAKKSSKFILKGVDVSQENDSPPLITNDASYKKTSKIISKQTLSNIKTELLVWTLIIIVSSGLVGFFFYTQIDRITMIDTISTLLFQLSFQRDKLTYLHSALLTQAYEIGEYTSIDLKEEETFDYLNSTSNIVTETLISFYRTLNVYNSKLSLKNISYLYNQTYIKVMHNWEEVEYQSDYVSEMNYALYLAGAAVREGDFEAISNDLEMIFFDEYKKNPKKEIESIFGAVFFFVNKNINLSLKVTINSLINEVTEYLKSFVTYEKIKSLILVFSWLISSVICFVASIKIVKKINKRLYTIVITMFLDKPKKVANIKNQQDNLAFKQKVASFVNLLRDFNEKNRQDFKDQCVKESEKYNNTFINDSLITSGNLTNSSILLTNPQSLNATTSASLVTTSQNNLITFTKSRKSLGINSQARYLSKKTSIRQLMTNTTNTNTKSNNSSQISNSRIIHMLSKKAISISIISYYLIIFVIIINAVIFGFHLNNIFYFSSFINYSWNLFITYTNYFYSFPSMLNSVESSILSKASINTTLFSYLPSLATYKDELSKIKESNKFSKFPNIQLLWESLHQNISKVNMTIICSGEPFCLRFVNKENGYCAKGVILAMELVIQKLQEIISDYSNYPKDNLDKAQLKVFLKEKDIKSIIENVNFVFSKVETILYSFFIFDYEKIKEFLFNQTMIMNFILIVTEIISFILIYSVISMFRRKVIKVQFGANKFNIAFNKGYK